jgi:hypothetical protein
MGRTSVLSHNSQHDPKRSATDSSLRILRRSVRKIIHGFRADRVEEIFDGIGELKLLTGWNISNEKNGRCYEKRHLDEPSRKIRFGKNRHYECIRPVSLQKNQNNVTTRDAQDLGDDLLQECLQLERCYHCGKARSSRTLQEQVDPLEQMICSRPSCAWLKAIIEHTVTYKDLVINIYHHNYYNNQLSKSPSSKEIIELPGHSDIPTNLTELPGEDLQRNAESAMPHHNHGFLEGPPPAIYGTTKPSRSLVERVVQQNKNWGYLETKQFAIGCRMCSERATFHHGEHPRCEHGMSLRR